MRQACTNFLIGTHTLEGFMLCKSSKLLGSGGEVWCSARINSEDLGDALLSDKTAQA